MTARTPIFYLYVRGVRELVVPRMSLVTTGSFLFGLFRLHRQRGSLPFALLFLRGQASRPISTPRLHPLLSFHLGPIYLVVYQGPSGTGRPVLGDLISGWASRLDAFSGYPLRTWLPGAATGVTTGTPEVRPLRSSRTRSGSPQVSCARGG